LRVATLTDALTAGSVANRGSAAAVLILPRAVGAHLVLVAADTLLVARGAFAATPDAQRQERVGTIPVVQTLLTRAVAVAEAAGTGIARPHPVQTLFACARAIAAQRTWSAHTLSVRTRRGHAAAIAARPRVPATGLACGSPRARHTTRRRIAGITLHAVASDTGRRAARAIRSCPLPVGTTHLAIGSSGPGATRCISRSTRRTTAVIADRLARGRAILHGPVAGHIAHSPEIGSTTGYALGKARVAIRTSAFGHSGHSGQAYVVLPGTIRRLPGALCIAGAPCGITRVRETLGRGGG
jgi:hypothetical protein